MYCLEVSYGFVYKTLGIFGFCEVGRYRKHLSFGATKLFCCKLKLLGVSRIEHDPAAFLGESESDRFPDTFAAPSDNSYFI
jgi:hypothetical protein